MKASAIVGAVEGVTKKWAKQRKREEREASARRNRRHVMIRRRTVSVNDAAWQIMETAYLKASANGTLPAHARQIMYAARPHIQATADRDLGARFDQYFTQQLLPEYIEANGKSLERRLRRARAFPRAAHRARGPARHPAGPELPQRHPQLRAARAQLQAVGRSAFRPSVRSIATAPSCSSRRKASCRCSRR